MYKIVGGDQREYGPVTAEQIRQWIAEGRANGSTRVQAEGGEWKPLSAHPEFADALAAKAGPPPPATWGAPAAFASVEELLARDVSLNIGDCLSRSFRLFRDNFVLLAVGTLLMMIANWGVVAVSMFIPFFGGFVSMAFSGVLSGGLYWLFLRRARGEPAGVGDVFAGFQRAFVSLLVAALLIGVLSGIGFLFCLIPGIYLAVAWKLSLVVAVDKQLDFWPAMEMSRRVATRHWWSIFGLLIVVGLIALVIPVLFGLGSVLFANAALAPLFMSKINSLGLPPEFASLAISFVVFIVGFALGGLVAAPIITPIAIGALVYAYEDLFGARPKQTA